MTATVLMRSMTNSFRKFWNLKTIYDRTDKEDMFFSYLTNRCGCLSLTHLADCARQMVQNWFLFLSVFTPN